MAQDSNYQRRSPWDLRRVGIKEDPTKDRRWVSKDRIEERKNVDGYTFVKPSENSSSSDGHVNSKGHVLMERPRELADESRKEKDMRTRMQMRAAKEALGNEVERLSSKHGKNLHKYVKED